MPILEMDPAQDARFMDAMGEYAVFEVARHIRETAERNPENYDEVLTREVIHELSGQPPMDAEPDVQQIFMGNVLVENGLPEYDRVSAEVFERNPYFRAWKNLWVSEEWSHGPSLQEWAKATGFVSIRELIERTQGYLRNGLSIRLASAAHGLAYPSFQEPATKITHTEVMRRLPKPKESLGAAIGRKTMGLVIAQEGGHEDWFTNMAGHALESDDLEIASAMMLALADAALGFSMPGIEKDIPDGPKITSAYKRTGVFTFRKLGIDVLLPALGAKDKYGWSIADRDTLTDEAKVARDTLVQFAADMAADEDRIARIIIRARREHGLMATAAM